MFLTLKPLIPVVFKEKTGNEQSNQIHEYCAKESTVLTYSLTHKVITARKEGEKIFKSLIY